LSGAALGQEWLVDASGCDAAALKDARALSALFEELVVALELHVLGTPQWHTFGGPGGVTGLAMLSESHLAIHTFPEHRYAALSIYSCKERPAFDVEGVIRRHLKAADVTVRALERGPK
jgi:S-adenosylmethionine decarboxylase